jgi:Tol biopolymer transport system component
MMMKRWKLAAVATAAVVVLAGCNKVTLVPTTTYQDGVRCMAQSLSADGKWLVYTTLDDPSGTTLNRKTILRNLATGTNRELAGWSGGTTTDTSISGDGGRVLLDIPNTSSSGMSSNGILYLWTVTSGTRTRITPLAESNRAGAISADGRKVVYGSENGKLLWLYDIGTRTRKAITRPSGLAADVALSVDAVSANGRFVVVTGDGKAYVRDAVNGTGWTLPTSGSELQAGIDISGDGRWVAFSLHKPSDPYARNNVYVWDRTTAAATRLTNSGGHTAAGQPSLDADGSHLAYTTADTSTGRFSLVTMTRSSKATSVVASSSRYFAPPSFAANGAKGSFCSQAQDLVSGSHGVPNLYTWG